jgi:TalC/MipB family fructose-6-phosphate aldolase
MVDGVTTNPSIILKSGRDILEVTREICAIVSGPVSAEVVATKAEDMIAEGRKLATIAPNITVKVPLTWDGLRACKVLTGEGKMVNVTLCFSVNQALIAALAEPTLREKLLVAGALAWEGPNSPADARAFLQAELAKFRVVVERTSIKLEP